MGGVMAWDLGLEGLGLRVLGMRAVEFVGLEAM